MKKKYKLRRILITLVSICAVFSMFCVPVIAKSSGWNEQSVRFNAFYRVRPAAGSWEEYPGSYDDLGNLALVLQGGILNPTYNDCLAYRLSEPNIKVDAGDTVSIPYVAGGVGGWLSAPEWSIIAYRWVVADSTPDTFPGYLAEGPWVSVNLAGYHNYNITWQNTNLSVVTASDTACVCLQIRFTSTDFNKPCTITMNNKSLLIGYGNASSPEAPKYAIPDGSAFNELHNKEDQILGDAQGGLDQASDLFGNTLSFLRSSSEAFLAVGALLTGLTGIGNNVIYGILVFSLSLGLFAFIFNMGLSIAEKSSRDVSRRDADGRKSNYFQPHGIASHRPFRE